MRRTIGLAFVIGISLPMLIRPLSAALVVDSVNYSHTQDFNFLSSSASPLTWVNDQGTQTTTGSPGWYWDGGINYVGDDGSSPSGSWYSYGSSSSDRAMGSLNTPVAGNSVFVWALVMQNLSSDPIENLTVTFTGEKWRNGDAVSDTVSFSYKISATNITDTEVLGGAVPSGWTAVPALNFTTVDAGDTGAVDGNAAANRTTLNASIPVAVPVNQFIALRWHDADISSSIDHGMAIDDLSVTTAVPEPGAVVFGGVVCSMALLVVLQRRVFSAIVRHAARLQLSPEASDR
jgi:hypothetical protein